MIEWIIIGAILGSLTVVFWDEIKAWANRAWNSIIDSINLAIEVISQALVYLIKEGGKIYRLMKVYVMDIYNRMRIETARQPISESAIPKEYWDELKNKQQVLLMKRRTS